MTGNVPNFVKQKYKFAKEYFSMYKAYHMSCDFLTDKSRFIFYKIETIINFCKVEIQQLTNHGFIFTKLRHLKHHLFSTAYTVAGGGNDTACQTAPFTCTIKSVK